MSFIEKSERIGGAICFFLPTFDSVLWIIDNYSRLEMATKLESYLPPYLTRPPIIFVCMCLGLMLLYMSQKNQLNRITKDKGILLDASGSEYVNVEKPNWLPVVIVVFAAVCAAPIFGVAQALRYQGPSPAKRPAPEPPSWAYQGSERPLIPTHGRPSPSVVLNSPQGFAISGGNVINPTINNNYGVAPPLDPTTMTYTLQHHLQGGGYTNWTEVEVLHTTKLSQPMFLFVCDQPILRFTFGLLDDGIVGTADVNGIHELYGANGPIPSDHWKAMVIDLPDPIGAEHAIQANVYNDVPTDCQAYSLSNKPINGKRIIPIQRASR